MVPVALVLVVAVVPLVAAGLVYADARRRGVGGRRRLWWSVAVGTVSAAGFLGALALDGPLFRTYVALTGAAPVVGSPRQLLAGLVAVGLAVSAAAVLAYGAGSRLRAA
jgi:hypothetical protein